MSATIPLYCTSVLYVLYCIAAEPLLSSHVIIIM